MRYPATTDENGQPTLAVEDKHGSGKHGFTDGSPVLYASSLGVNGDATEIRARTMDDLVRNVKEACIEGNGEAGALANAVNDDPFELADSICTAPDLLHGATSFVGRGLRFTYGGGTLAVTLSAGRFSYLGRSYWATASMLSDIVVEVDEVDAGNGDAFTLLASRDHYISIGPVTTEPRTVSIQVRDVANEGAAPAVPSGHFVFAVLRTDGTGVTDCFYRAFPRVMQPSGSYGVEVADGDSNNTIGRLLPTGGMDIGWNLDPSDAAFGESTSAGRFVGTVYHQRSHRRRYTTSGRLRDRTTLDDFTTTTSGNATSHVTIFDLSDLPNRSRVLFTASVIAESDQDQTYSRIITRTGGRNSVAAVALYGSDVNLATHDPDTIGCSATITISGNNVRVSCAGAVGHDITWRIDVTYNQLRGATI